jgi:hypothetical protein
MLSRIIQDRIIFRNVLPFCLGVLDKLDRGIISVLISGIK